MRKFPRRSPSSHWLRTDNTVYDLVAKETRKWVLGLFWYYLWKSTLFTRIKGRWTFSFWCLQKVSQQPEELGIFLSYHWWVAEEPSLERIQDDCLRTGHQRDHGKSADVHSSVSSWFNWASIIGLTSQCFLDPPFCPIPHPVGSLVQPFGVGS